MDEKNENNEVIEVNEMEFIHLLKIINCFGLYNIQNGNHKITFNDCIIDGLFHRNNPINVDISFYCEKLKKIVKYYVMFMIYVDGTVKILVNEMHEKTIVFIKRELKTKNRLYYANITCYNALYNGWILNGEVLV